MFRKGRSMSAFGLAAALVMCSGLTVSAAAKPRAADQAPARAAAKKPQAGFVYRIKTPRGERMVNTPAGVSHSVARRWNETLLFSIENDRARPTVHARNLYHTCIAMWDAWAAYDAVADQVLHHERATAANVQAAREEAISFAAYRVMRHRFAGSPGAGASLPAMDALMNSLGYDRTFTSTVGSSPAALGNRIAASIIAFGLADGSNEQNGFANRVYAPVNPPLFPDLPGNPDMLDPNRWQPLSLEFFIDQAGFPVPLGSLAHLTPEWGAVTPFALNLEDATQTERDGFNYIAYHDPGDPPYLNGEGDDYYRWGNELVVIWSSHLDPADGVTVDISPANFGNSALPDADSWASYYKFFEGGDSGTGRALNPVTGMPYPPQIVKRGDYTRVLAEFWADGPNSETPPGHWFTILNYVTDHPLFERRYEGQGPVLDPLEWDVKAYLTLGGAMHDCAITAWGCKGRYDYPRPISAIRYMAGKGQSSDPEGPSYHPEGIRLYPGLIEVITPESAADGQRHRHLRGFKLENIGKIAVNAWRGPNFIDDPATTTADVGWILAEEWWPYQRPTFVTPPFAGYVSGHSTYSRGAAEVMTRLTGTEYFPGGVGEFFAPQNQFLVFEDGPSTDVTLQWATYRDASDQTSLSRIWGGIHPPCDDLPGRTMGFEAGTDAFLLARRIFGGQVTCPADMDASGGLDVADVTGFLNLFIAGDDRTDVYPVGNPDRRIDINDVLTYAFSFNAGCP